MVSLHRRRADEPAASAEDPTVRKYRFLLRQAPPDAVERAHVQALSKLSEEQRQGVLSAVQAGLLAGQRLTSRDTPQIAHLIVHGERRAPNAYLTACEPRVLGALADEVVHSESCLGLFDRYVAWDGMDPEVAEDTSGAGFNPKVGQRDPRDDIRTTQGGYGP